MTILGGILIASCAFMLGIIIGGIMAGGKVQDLQDRLAAKRESLCGECRFKLDSKGFDEQLATERKSKYDALRYKEKELNELRSKLYEATRQHGIKHLSENVAR